MKLTESLNLEDHFSEVKEKVRDKQIEDTITKRYELLHHLIIELLSDPQKHCLEKILYQTRLLNKEEYTADAHIGLIIYFESVKSHADNILVSKMVTRVQSHLKKEVQFFKLKNPESDFYHDICNKALASVGNLIHLTSKLTEDQLNVNVLLNAIINYRQKTLSDEEAWDHIAQTILRTMKKAPS